MQIELMEAEQTAVWQTGYCVVCGDKITGTSSYTCRNRFCFAKWNNWTRIKDRWHELHRTCEWCGEVFRVYKKPTDANPQLFCSNECSGPGAIWGTKRSMNFRLWIRGIRAERHRRMQQRGKPCEICGEFTNRGMNATTCAGECDKERDRRRELERAINKHKANRFACRECGATVVTEYGDRRRVFCSPRCSDKEARRNQARTHRARCKKYGVPHVYGITREKVMARDGWKCGICGERIKRKRPYPHPEYGSIDHIIPLSCDGSPGHVWTNVQAAHLGCNVDKGAGVAAADQLRLL